MICFPLRGAWAVRRFLAVAHGDRLEALFVVALTTGLRRGELLGLKWEDVDLSKGTLHVRRSAGRVYKGGVQVGEPKSASGRRQVLLSRQAIQALREHRPRQSQDRLLAGEQWQEKGFIFTSATGTPVESSTLARAFERLTERAELPRIPFHGLRHTYASMMLAEGVHPKIVQQALGHAKISLTLDLYSHALPTLQEQAVQAVERALEASSKPIATV
ncbi:MAG: site-specific integrase [Chloroflexota bacterium]|nr:MAG: site-specific integrase [Chloroflexota bacterium]